MANHELTVVSFNLKRDGPFTYLNKWKDRKNYVAAAIRNSGAQIVGVQEMTPAMREDLQILLPDYGIFGVSRRKNNKSEHSDIMVRLNSAKMKHYQTFWLSKHPQKAGSRAYYAAFPRICTVAETEVEGLDRPVRIFNTHFDHICGSARTLGIRTILKYMEIFQKKEPMPTVLMGDFNARPNSKPLKVMKSLIAQSPQISLQSVFDSHAKITNTHHHFNGKLNHMVIDYIFISSDFQVVQASVDKSAYNGRYPSDHYPLIATLRLK